MGDENAPAGRQPRLLLFVHDGTGLGHLQRVCRLARALQGPCACLVLTGHRAASWMVPAEAEFVHLPSLDSLLVERAADWGRQPFLDAPPEEALALRRALINATVAAFRPDALIVDHLPLGKNGELSDVVCRVPVRKYLVLRGVLGHPPDVRREILGGGGEAALTEHYARILVACDRRVCDVAEEYAFPPVLRERMTYLGYVGEPVGEPTVRRVRRERGISAGEKWVVCSAGGGRLGERLTEACVRIARRRPDTFFDIVLGPRSSARWPAHASASIDAGRMRLTRESRHLALLHAAADVVVCSGGYNSLVESLQGRAEIVCVPMQRQRGDEQYLHAQRLSRFHQIRRVLDLRRLGGAVASALERNAAEPALGEPLAFDGAARARSLIFRDLGLAPRDGA